MREDIAATILAFVVEAGTDIRTIIAFMGNVLTADPSAGIARVGGFIPINSKSICGIRVYKMDAHYSAALARAIRGIIILDRASRMAAPYAATAITQLGILLPCGIAVRAGMVAGVAAGIALAVFPAGSLCAALMDALHGAAGIGALAILFRPIVGVLLG